MNNKTNMISELRRRVISGGTATITAEEFDQLQAEWITRTRADYMVGSDIPLDERMKAAGMMSLSEILERLPAGIFTVHAGVKDLESFGDWLDMRRKEMVSLQASIDLNKDAESDLYEWAVAHAAVFTEAVGNFRAAMAGERAKA